jgi:hypothetical protein
MSYRRQSIIVQEQVPQQQKRATVLAKPPVQEQPSYFDMMEEALLQTIRSSSMALLDLYKRRGQAQQEQTKYLPPPPKYLPPPPVMTLPPQPIQRALPTIQPPKAPRVLQPTPPKAPIPAKISLDNAKLESIANKILNDVDDLLDEDFVLIEVLNQSHTWNSLRDKLNTESLKALVKCINLKIESMFEEVESPQEEVNVIESILNDVFAIFKNTKQAIANPQMFVQLLDKTAKWNKLGSPQKKEILKPLYNQFNSRKADFMRDVYPVAKPSGSMSTGSPTNKNDGSDKGRGVQELGEPSQYSPVHSYGVSNLDKSDAYGRTPANNMNNIREVQNAPGSSRVIPQNSGFVNNASTDKSSRVSQLREAILNDEIDDDMDDLYLSDEDDNVYDDEDDGGNEE